MSTAPTIMIEDERDDITLVSDSLVDVIDLEFDDRHDDVSGFVGDTSISCTIHRHAGPELTWDLTSYDVSYDRSLVTITFTTRDMRWRGVSISHLTITCGGERAGDWSVMLTREGVCLTDTGMYNVTLTFKSESMTTIVGQK